jgi:UDP-N-acetylmuramate dehydrogenase
MARKKASQPVTAASAGCVFKNPAPETPAGRLLEAAGFKGKRLGGMAFSGMHANFLVNEGEGASADALELMEMAKRAVYEQTGIMLEPEVRLWL